MQTEHDEVAQMQSTSPLSRVHRCGFLQLPSNTLQNPVARHVCKTLRYRMCSNLGKQNRVQQEAHADTWRADRRMREALPLAQLDAVRAGRTQLKGIPSFMCSHCEVCSISLVFSAPGETAQEGKCQNIHLRETKDQLQMNQA